MGRGGGRGGGRAYSEALTNQKMGSKKKVLPEYQNTVL